MLYLDIHPRRTTTGHFIEPWYVSINLEIDSVKGPIMQFRIDTGADFTMVPMGHVTKHFGIDAATIRKKGKPISTKTLLGGQRVSAHLYPVQAEFCDDNGGWVRWNSEFAFYDGNGSRTLAGHVGFLELFNIRRRLAARTIELEPARPPSHDFSFCCGPERRSRW